MSRTARRWTIARARKRGLKIYGETCPQYLMLTEQDLDGLNMEGAKYVCSPPPRDQASQVACWEGLQQGVFSLFSSDHCPFRYDEQGKLAPKGRTRFRWVPNGIPGVETRLPILFSEGVGKGRITLNEFVALTATNHAKTYGLYPKKGTIAVGCDADIAIWDPKRTVTITQGSMHGGCDYTPYEGLEVTGWPVSTMLRGKFVVRDGKLVGAKAMAPMWRGTNRRWRRHASRDALVFQLYKFALFVFHNELIRPDMQELHHGSRRVGTSRAQSKFVGVFNLPIALGLGRTVIRPNAECHEAAVGL